MSTVRPRWRTAGGSLSTTSDLITGLSGLAPVHRSHRFKSDSEHSETEHSLECYREAVSKMWSTGRWLSAVPNICSVVIDALATHEHATTLNRDYEPGDVQVYSFGKERQTANSYRSMEGCMDVYRAG